MAAIRRNPGLCATVGTLLLLFGIGLFFHWRPLAQAEPSGYPALGAMAAAQAESLRCAAGLDDNALACINATNEQLTSILSSFRSWYETHRDEWLVAQCAVSDQQACIRQLESAVNNGHDEHAALETARQQLAQLEAALATQTASLRSGCLGALSDSQRSLLDHMLTRVASPMPMRVLGLTAEQDRALTSAATSYHQTLALARDAQTRTALARTYVQQVDATIGPANVPLLAALAEYRGPAAQRVVTILQQVFPVPPEG